MDRIQSVEVSTITHAFEEDGETVSDREGHSTEELLNIVLCSPLVFDTYNY